MKQALFFLLIGTFFSLTTVAQEQLPDFSVYKVGGGRVVISWTHNFNDIKQVSIQRSSEKNNFFKTIITMPDPTIQQNGFSDVKAPNDSMYYRIFVMREGGKFFTTTVKQPTVDSLGLAEAYASNETDEIINQNVNFLPQGFVQSKYIYTSPDRYIRVELPFDKRKYSIKFFNNYNQPMFEMENVKEKRFKLDRSYFGAAGTFNFDLYADGRLIEKGKIYIPKEF
ncbi:MAG: hypothetical protein ACK5NK_02250 [Niabella sp.]